MQSASTLWIDTQLSNFDITPPFNNNKSRKFQDVILTAMFLSVSRNFNLSSLCYSAHHWSMNLKGTIRAVHQTISLRLDTHQHYLKIDTSLRVAFLVILYLNWINPNQQYIDIRIKVMTINNKTTWVHIVNLDRCQYRKRYTVLMLDWNWWYFCVSLSIPNYRARFIFCVIYKWKYKNYKERTIKIASSDASIL